MGHQKTFDLSMGMIVGTISESDCSGLIETVAPPRGQQVIQVGPRVGIVL